MSALPVPPVVEQEVLAPYRDPVAALDDIGIEHRCDAAVAAARAAVVADPDALSLTSYSAESTYRVKRGRDEGEEDNVPDAVERHLLHIEATAAAAVQALRAERVCRASFIKTMEAFKALPEAESHVDMADERQAEAVDFFTRKVAFSICRVARIEIKDNVTDRFTMCEAVIHGSLRVGTVGIFNDSISLHRGWTTSFGPAASSGIQIGRYGAGFKGGSSLASVRVVEPTKATVAKAMEILPQDSPLHGLPWKAFGLLMQIASLIVLCEEEWELFLDEGPERLGAAKAVAIFAKAHRAASE